jgi:selT/selW/selH-like putative selenoprotein
MNQPRSGAFEITINNKLVFSKLQGSAFPTKMQIEKLLI